MKTPKTGVSQRVQFGEPLQWQELGTCPPGQPRFYFQGESLVNFEFAPGGSVLQHLELFLDDEVIGDITNEMKWYVAQCLIEKPSSSRHQCCTVGLMVERVLLFIAAVRIIYFRKGFDCRRKSSFIFRMTRLVPIYTTKEVKWLCLVNHCFHGERNNLDDTFKNISMSSQLVRSLIKPLFEKGYCITTDNFYTSPKLVMVLIFQSCDAYGTLDIIEKITEVYHPCVTSPKVGRPLAGPQPRGLTERHFPDVISATEKSDEKVHCLFLKKRGEERNDIERNNMCGL
ncbi:hypothetical protein J437_LFUL018176 [Ladona fulva]|uniref:PiggyBac transposable element-derived protein domain-containing protein n=1 Tax=Ladona fulva TaxID=123851 RepID=A0A8K0KQG4_LADFU|nr:hypothetical protein J437_LFUL018176 [Ladona fulva]